MNIIKEKNNFNKQIRKREKGKINWSIHFTNFAGSF